jgi:hypothetical protein
MAPKPAKRIPGISEPKDESDVWIVGLRKIPNGTEPRYVVVTGTIANPIFDKTPDRFESACELMKRALLHLTSNVP